MRRIGSPPLCAAIAVLALCACGEVAEDTRPESFGSSCTLDSAVCVSPCSCTDIPDFGLRCTKACSTDADCPSFHSTGHCEGDFTSTCLSSGFCDPLICL